MRELTGVGPSMGGGLRAEHPGTAAAVLDVPPPVRGDVAGVADRQAVHVGRGAEGVDDLERGGLLPLDAQRVDRVDQRHRVVQGEVAGQGEAVVERAGHLQQRGAVHERLGELAECDLALGHEDCAGQPGPGGVRGGAGAGVAGGGADDCARVLPEGPADRHRHPAVLERAGGVGALDLEVHLAASQLGQVPGGHQRSTALAQRHYRGRSGDRKAVPVLLDHSPPGPPGGRHHGHASPPSTRMTLLTARTTSRSRRSSTVDASAASVAAWVTITRLASSPWPSWRTLWIDTSWRAKAPATAASTPALSATSRLTW